MVRERDALRLIDALIPGSADAILAAAAEIGAPIVRVSLTQAHHDHTGSPKAVVQRLAQVEVSFGAREARFLRGDWLLGTGETRERARAR